LHEICGKNIDACEGIVVFPASYLESPFVDEPLKYSAIKWRFID